MGSRACFVSDFRRARGVGYGEHGAGGFADDGVGDAAQDHATERAAAVRSNDDEVGWERLRGLDDLGGSISLAKDGLNVQVVGERRLDALEQSSGLAETILAIARLNVSQLGLQRRDEDDVQQGQAGPML